MNRCMNPLRFAHRVMSKVKMIFPEHMSIYIYSVKVAGRRENFKKPSPVLLQSQSMDYRHLVPISLALILLTTSCCSPPLSHHPCFLIAGLMVSKIGLPNYVASQAIRFNELFHFFQNMVRNKRKMSYGIIPVQTVVPGLPQMVQWQEMYFY